MAAPQQAPGAVSPRGRGLVGRLLLLSAAMMIVLAAAFWWGALPIDPAVRPYVAAALLIAGLADGLLGLRFLGEVE